MDDNSLNLIFGIIFLFLLVNTMFLWGIISSNNGQYSPNNPKHKDHYPRIPFLLRSFIST